MIDAFFKFRVNTIRNFEDGDYVFVHTEYDFSNRVIEFERFRFADQYRLENRK